MRRLTGSTRGHRDPKVLERMRAPLQVHPHSRVREIRHMYFQLGISQKQIVRIFAERGIKLTQGYISELCSGKYRKER